MKEHWIVDAHTHIFPRDIPANWDWYAQQDTTFKFLTAVSPNSRVREAWATPEQTIQREDEAGVDTVVMQGWYWQNMDLCRRHNDFMAEVIQQYPDRFAAYGSINPCFGKEAVKEVERCYEMGFAGIGELGPGGDHFALDDPGLLDVLEAASALHLPVNFHVGEPVGHVYPGKDLTPIAGFCDLARRFPELKLILAHMGGGLPFYELMPEVKATFRNVYYDLAANPLLYDIRAVRLAVDLVGADKVLYGTDFPLTIYPRITREQDLSLFLKDIRDNAHLTQEEWNKVMGDTMHSLLENSGKKYQA